MTSATPRAPGRSFTVDVTVPQTPRRGFDDFRRGWDTQVGGAFPLPAFDTGDTGDFRVSVRASKVADTVIADLYSESMAGHTRAGGGQDEDRVLIHVLRRGAWQFAGPRGGEVSVPAGHFIVRATGTARFLVKPRTTATVLILPGPVLRPLLRERHLVGPADSPEVRVLLAHAGMLEATLGELTPAGVRASRDALVELAKGLAGQGFDDHEPRLAPALAQAAKDLIEGRLTDPGLSPSSVARELNVSLRTLQRATAVAGDSIADHIRRRRLEQARLELAGPATTVRTISEIAARWQFADSSHFTRSFKRQYGQTPSEYARSRRATAER
ncbi:helix-turn-helix domain-containing protein [Amycolatopsis pigmentata]|uniref:Helix-turn-helix domain-containing protein n=1 Tax=Amycolatopsis pigmentata TaxID=450801 RepID=A0ABW5G3D4_9PSEU